MKLINATDFTSVNPKYIGVPQPMAVYYSKEEVRVNEKNPKMYSNWKEFYAEVYSRLPDMKIHEYLDMSDKCIFVPTGEKCEVDKIGKDGIRYLIKNKPVEDNYLRVYGYWKRFGDVAELITSSGVWNISNKGSRMSGGVPIRLRSENQWNSKIMVAMSKKKLEKKRKKLVESSVEVANDYKFAQYLLHPNSPTFLNLFGSAKMSYGNDKGLTITDLENILESPRVRNLITKQMRIFMPRLSEAVKEGLDAKALAGLLIQIATDTVNNKAETVDNKLKAVQAVVNVGYGEESLVLDYGAAGSESIANNAGMPTQNLINSNEPETKAIGLTEISTNAEDVIEDEFDENYIIDEGSDKPKP